LFGVHDGTDDLPADLRCRVGIPLRGDGVHEPQPSPRGGGERSLDDVEDLAPGATGDPQRADVSYLAIAGARWLLIGGK
jgi:hypothetical protein